MSYLSYHLIRGLGLPVVWVTSSPVVLHRERAARPGGYILAANHLSPYDVAGLMAVSPRDLDFVSIVQFRDKPLVGTFFRAMNCTFIDRRKNNPGVSRELVDRLQAGRVVAMFPEAGIRKFDDSVLVGGSIRPGVVHLAQTAGVPIVPCAIVGTGVYSKFSSWYPLRAVHWGIAYGEPITVTDRGQGIERLRRSFRDLYEQLRATGRLTTEQ